MAALKERKSSLTSFQINRIDHSRQTASFEERDRADIELIVVALIHDVGNELEPQNHFQVYAKIIQSLSLDEVTWVLQMHGLFYKYCYVDKLSLEKNCRDIFSEYKLLYAAAKFRQK